MSETKTDQKSSSGVGARAAAARAVTGVMDKHLTLDAALASAPVYKDLAPRDRAFARLIAATTLRRMGQIDAALKPYINRPPSPYAHALLRTGAAQLLFLGTPVHAAVGESVSVLKRSRSKGDVRAAGMANAVLRRVSEHGAEHIKDIPDETNLPDWLQQSWRKAYGQDALRSMAWEITKSPPLDISVKSDPEKWAQAIEGEVLSTDSVRKSDIGNVTALAGFETGDWWVQDVSAALPVYIVQKLLGDLTGKTALDMCAAPGGKSLQLAAAGAEVTALDRSPERLKLMEKNLERTGLSAKCIAADAAKWRGLEDNSFDIVLLDAPCSATGTMRRNPDVMFNKSPKDVKSLTAVQDRLLLAATRQLKPSGTLIYCTCSLEQEEGEQRIRHFLRAKPDFRLIPLLDSFSSSMELGASREGYLRALPHFLGGKGGMDGFFIAIMRRNV
ncbi:MAG: RsmB/NOP family class I SAM-dependent RNA methyltransferase [Robiginitomaculum sp.]